MINKEKDYQVSTRYGKSDLYRSFLDLKFKDESGEELSMQDLLNKSFLNETDIKTLKNQLENFISNENRVDSLITQQLDLLSKKVARLEQEVKEIKEEK